MSVVDLSISKKAELANKTDYLGDRMRDEAQGYAKDFKTSWLQLGRHLYSIYEDKKYYGWGFDKFEDYTEKELGLKKSLCLKLLKAYIFIEEDEPEYLEEDFMSGRTPEKVPNYDQIDVLRLAKSKTEILKDDYRKLRAEVFDRGREAGEVRKELTCLIKERKQVDPDEERDARNALAIRRVLTSLRSFKKDMEALKLVPGDVIAEIDGLIERLEREV